MRNFFLLEVVLWIKLFYISHTHMYTHTHVHTHLHTHTYVHTYIHALTRTYIHKLTRTCTYTYTLTRTYTYTLTGARGPGEGELKIVDWLYTHVRSVKSARYLRTCLPCSHLVNDGTFFLVLFCIVLHLLHYIIIWTHPNSISNYLFTYLFIDQLFIFLFLFFSLLPHLSLISDPPTSVLLRRIWMQF